MEEEIYTDYFESLSTRDAASSGGSSSTITQDSAAAKQHGFALSPIHASVMYASELSDSSSSMGSHAKSESETPKVATTGLSMKSDSKLLKGRASKPSLLNSKQSPIVSAPASNILPQDSVESSKSIDSSHSSFTVSDSKFTPLAPLSDHHVVPSNIAQKVDSVTDSNRDKNTSVLKPLETDSALVKPNEGDRNKPVSGWDGQKHDVRMLSSVSSDIPLLVQSNENDTQLQPGRRLSNVLTSSLHHNSTVDTLTAVTDIADSSIAGATDGQLTEVQSALVAAGLSQINTAQQKPETPTHFQHSARSAAEGLCIPSHERGVAGASDDPAKDLTYESLNIQELIRAITSEEIASAGKEILEGTPMQELPPPPKVVKRTLKVKPKTVDTSADHSGFKAKQTVTSKQRTQLSSSRESLLSQGSRSDSSLRKQTAPHSRTKTRSSGRDNSTRTAQANTKRSKLPHKSDKEAVKTNIGHKQAQKAPSLAPRPCHSPAERREESNFLSDLLGIEANTTRRLIGREEPFVKEVSECCSSIVSLLSWMLVW